jgi:hypothetical protein
LTVKGVDRRVKIITICASFGSLAQLVEQLAFNQLVEGSNPSRPTKSENELVVVIVSSFRFSGLRLRRFRKSTSYGSLAQLVEQLAFNQLVEGSNPSRPTNEKGSPQLPERKEPSGSFFLPE